MKIKGRKGKVSATKGGKKAREKGNLFSLNGKKEENKFRHKEKKIKI